MLDVHPPQHSAHSWKDFFIHIATIVVGLVIAVGLEQTVEYFHHRYEVRETREALARERDANRTKFANRCRYWHVNTAVLENNLLVLRYLQQHPGTPQDKLPGVLEWRHLNVDFDSSAWNGAQTSGVLPLMPQEEATREASLYTHLQDLESSNQTWQILLSAHQFAISDPDPSHLSPAQVESEIELLQKAFAGEFDQAVKLYNLARIAPDFPACMTRDDFAHIYQEPDAQSTAGPRAESEKRMKAAGWTPLTLTPNGWVATAAAAPAPATQP